MKKLAQILTVVFAISLLTGFVLYSQQRHTRRIAPGSKADIGTLKEIKPAIDTWRSNMAQSSPPIQPTTNNQTSTVQSPRPNPALFAPGSKSAAVFTFDTKDASQHTPAKISDSPPANLVLATNGSPNAPTKQLR